MENEFYRSFRLGLRAALFCFALTSYVSLPQVKAQEVLWGAAVGESPLNWGFVFSVNADGSDYQVRKVFGPSYEVMGGLLELEDGYFYGYVGDGFVATSIARFSADNLSFEIIKELDADEEGRNFIGALESGPDGYLYGVTSAGGERNFGTLFKINPDGSGFQVIWNFTNSSPFSRRFSNDHPLERLLYGADGRLYGWNQSREVFGINTDGSNYSVITRLSTNYELTGKLIQDQQGLLYVQEINGTLFQLANDNSGDYNEFSVPNNRFPTGHLLDGNDGWFYGMFLTGGSEEQGSIFRINRNWNTIETLYNFTETDGYPSGALQEYEGVLYGVTFSDTEDGQRDYSLFNINKNGSDFSKIADLDIDNIIHQGHLKLTGEEDLFGATKTGIFKISPDGSDLLAINSVPLNPEGSYPVLIRFDEEHIYGYTERGGEFGFGALFRIDPDGGDFQTLEPLRSSITGGIPYNGGYLFYSNFPARIYQVDGNGENLEEIRRFSSDEGRIMSLLPGSDNQIYGTLTTNEERGKIFSLAPDGSGYTVLQDFEIDDEQPGLFLAFEGEDGLLYGSGSIYERGTIQIIFRTSPDGSTFEILEAINRRGVSPSRAVHPIINSPDGFIYGFLEYPGETYDSDGNEVVYGKDIFRLGMSGEDFEVIYEFDDDGPLFGGKLLDGDGVLYAINSSIYKVAKDGSESSLILSENIYRQSVLVLPSSCPLPAIPTPLLSESAVGIDSEIIAYVNLPESHTWISATWHWGDGETSEATFTDSTAVGSHVYTRVGSYSVTLKVTDDCGTATSPATQVEVTDEALPSTGSVKGAGMFSSPRGAYVDKPQIKGMAHFSLVAKAADGEVSGTFQFRVADLHFIGIRFDRLLVEDNRAWLHGEGKIRGKGNYGFLIAAVDNQGSKEKDLLRVKIWDKDNKLIYDNQQGDPDDAVATHEIHRGTVIILGEDTSSERELDKDLILDRLSKIKAFPNPVQDRITIDLGDISPELIHTLLTDAYGHLEVRDRHRILDGNRIEFDLGHLRQGTYYIRIETREGHQTIKILKK